MDFGEELEEAGGEVFFGAGGAGGEFVVDAEGFGEDLADGHAGVEGGVGILEDDGEVAAEAAELAGGGVEEVDGRSGGGGGFGGGVEDLAGGGFDEAEEEAGEGGFAGAGFADEAEGFAAGEGEGDVVDDGVGAVGFGEVVGGEEGHRGIEADSRQVDSRSAAIACSCLHSTVCFTV